HSDCGQKPHVAQKRFRELTNVSFRVLCAETCIPHQFLGIVCPTFRERIPHKHLPESGGHTIRMQELQEMPRPNLMSGSKQERCIPRKVGLLLGGRPFWVWRGYVVNRWQTHFEGPRNINVCEIPSLIWGGFIDVSFLSPWNRHKIVIGHKSSQFFQLLSRRFHGITFGLVRYFFRNTFGKCLARGELSACLLQ